LFYAKGAGPPDDGTGRCETSIGVYFFNYLYESNDNCVHLLVNITEIAGLMS